MILELTKQNILNLTNESKRKNILAAWRSWGIWHKALEIGLSVYRLDLPDGSFFTASWYAGDDFFPGGGTHNVNRPRFNLCDIMSVDFAFAKVAKSAPLFSSSSTAFASASVLVWITL